MNCKTKSLSILGTGSDVGKSVVVTGLCRLFAGRGIDVAPFKAQNMSNNSGVTTEGLEMGRAQIVQAEAARVPPHVDMNPLLLKPTSDIGSQVVLLGSVAENCSAFEYHKKKEVFFKEACNAYDRLSRRHELVIMEGAGSCAEVNLMQEDIVNLRMADYADAPVVLVADIHRGGVFAQIVGTLACLDKRQQDQIAGFIINRFRGDITLFKDGSDWLEKKTGKPVFGVIPWYNHITIEAEDSVVIEKPERVQPVTSGTSAIAVLRLPHISNFTDFDPLTVLEDLGVVFMERPADLSRFRAIILPGSKNTRSDLLWLKESGWMEKIDAYHNKGGHILGICGGYQMLGRQVIDPDGIEGPPGATRGLGLLPVATELKAPKTTSLTRFTWGPEQGEGYEIHMGQTHRFEGKPLFSITARHQKACCEEDGCQSPDGRVLGTYIHGMFDSPGVIKKWLAGIGIDPLPPVEAQGPVARDQAYDQLAEHFQQHLDMAALEKLVTQGEAAKVLP